MQVYVDESLMGFIESAQRAFPDEFRVEDLGHDHIDGLTESASIRHARILPDRLGRD